jgi:EEF1A lysine methyltransferase 1
VMDAFRGYGLERKGAALGYHSVKQSTQERIFLYGPRADWTADDSQLEEQ